MKSVMSAAPASLSVATAPWISSIVAMPVESTTGFPVAAQAASRSPPAIRRTPSCRRRHGGEALPPLPDKRACRRTLFGASNSVRPAGPNGRAGSSQSRRARCLALRLKISGANMRSILKSWNLTASQPSVGGRIDEGQGAGKIAAMIAGGFGNEDRP